MSKENQEQCFEVAAHQQQIQQLQTGKSPLLGQANPIYAKKIEQSDIDYDGSIALKILPPMLPSDIKSYTPFKLGNKIRNEGWQKKQKEERERESQQNNAELAKIKFFTSQQNPFMRFFEKDEIVYCKYNNSKHNMFKEVSYFAGTFIPRDVLSSKIRSNWRQQKIINNVGQLIQGKNKNANKVSSLSNQPFLTKKNTIQFDSKFQSGNLFSAFKTGKYQYNLVLNNDINSKGSTQWFFFSTDGMEPNIDYVFNIVNFTKNDSLFNYGMKPVYYSMTENNGVSPFQQSHLQSNRKGWYRCGKDVKYFKGEIQRQNSNRFYYTLSFTVSTRFQNDKIYIAHSYPYTYTRSLNLMKSLINKNVKSQEEKKVTKTKGFSNVQQIKIGKTIGNRQLLAYLISPKRTPRAPSKQCIVIMARQHPGQTQGSFVCQGIIKLLTQSTPSKQIRFLLQNYQIYVIPMVNPDGVIFGNYRTNLSGKDLNRKWDSNDPNNLSTLLVPQVVAIKQFLSNLVKVNNLSIRFVLDLHGHSKKLNSFFYGNPSPDNPEVTKIYPYICSRFSQAIQYMDCTFACEQYKKKAARVYLSSVFQQLHVYTFQSSFYGYRNRQGKIVQFTPIQYAKLGQSIMRSLYILLVRDKDNENPQNSLLKMGSELEEPQIRQSIETYLKLEKQLKQDLLLMKIGDAESSGSQSRPEEGELNNEQIEYVSQQQEQVDSRVVVNSSKAPTKELSQKTKVEASKSKSIRINSRKTVQQNTIQYKEFSKQYRNKKLITISQVNGVLADKYHISLLPIQRVAYKSGKKVDVEVQTEKTQKLAIRFFKHFQIQQKNGLTGYMDFNFQEPSEEQSVSNIFGARGHSLSQKGSQQQKRHSEIVAEIQKNGRNLVHKSNNQTEKQLINKRKLSQMVSIKQPPNRNSKPKRRQVFTQTIATFRNLPVKQARQLNPIQYSNQILTKQRELQNQSRIAQMEKINKEVLRIYSKKSAIIDLGSKQKLDRSLEKSYKEFTTEKLQLNSFKRY